MICRYLFLIIVLFAGHEFFAQLPKSDIYSFQLKETSDGLELYNPTYLTIFNVGNYNNQVNCIPDNRLSFSSEIEETGQTDIQVLNFNNQTVTNVTASEINEFSSNYNPIHQTWYFVTQDDASIQYLWEYPSGLRKAGNPLFPDISNVGYYSLIGDMYVALFLVGEPHELKLYSRDGTFLSFISNDPGRSFAVDKDENLYFIHKYNDTYWYLKRFNLKEKQSEIVVKTLPGVEDFALVDNRIFIAGKGSILYQFNPSTDAEWLEFVDLQTYNINDIRRVTVCGDKLFLVNEIQ